MDLSGAKLKEDGVSSKGAKQKKNSTLEETNWVAAVLNIIGWISIVLSIVVGSVIASNGSWGRLGAIYAILGVISSLFIVGFAEIIRLLHKIYLNTKKSPPV